jgi:hypothetical protein
MEEGWTYNAGMFDLIEDPPHLQVKWWTLPSLILTVFCLGVVTGALIARRNTDYLEWAQVPVLAFLAWRIYQPTLHQLKSAVHHGDGHAH